MRLLLDTHTLLWFLEDDHRLSVMARSSIEDGINHISVSVASLWEIAIKISLGKLSIGGPVETFLPQQLATNGIETLGITVPHLAAVATLPFHHRDPFDRLIIAQAMVEGVPVVGADGQFDAYPITRLW